MNGLLFEYPTDESKKKTNSKTGSQIKLKKGDSIETLIETARRLVEEKLGKYKDLSRCVMSINELQDFFDSTPDNSYIAIDTETTRLILG